MAETITHGEFHAGLARLRRIENAAPAQSEIPVNRSSLVVTKAIEAQGLTLAELNLIFKGA